MKRTKSFSWLFLHGIDPGCHLTTQKELYLLSWLRQPPRLHKHINDHL